MWMSFLILLALVGLFEILVSRAEIGKRILGAVDERKNEVNFSFDLFIFFDFELVLDGFEIGKLENQVR